jgi:hypothetical protein
MPDDERGKPLRLGAQCGADRRLGAAEFRQRMKMPVGWGQAMHVDLDAGCRQRLKARAQPVDIRRLFDRIDEALIPDPRASGRVGHAATRAW